MADSILDDIKKLLGIEPEYTQFDQDVILHINSVFALIHQLGAGPQDQVFFIQDKTNTWDEFIADKTAINMVKSYIYAKVRLMFDPPQTSFGITALEKVAAEFESRLNYLENLFIQTVI